MIGRMKLFLYSFAFTFSDEQSAALAALVGKKPEEIRLACIDNAADIIPDSNGWREQVRDLMQNKGYQVEVIDLQKYVDNNDGLQENLTSQDIIWLGGGNTFYLRWILKKTGADTIITSAVQSGTVYAGWSAGGIMAGPTLRGFEAMEDLDQVPEVIYNSLDLTDIAIVPHVDNPDFAEAAEITIDSLAADGRKVQPLTDTQALVINGDTQTII